MSAVPFDTLKFARRLEAAGLSAEQAEIFTSALVEAAETYDLATKTDPERVWLATKTDLERGMLAVKTDLERALAETKADVIKWQGWQGLHDNRQAMARYR